MNGAPPCPERGRDDRPVLLVLSHLRWDFVFQRPQHLMTRAAASYEVVFCEEPLVEDGAEPRLDRFQRGDVLVLRPPVKTRSARASRRRSISIISGGAPRKAESSSMQS